VATLKLQSNGPLYSNTLAVDEWAVTARRGHGPGWAAARPSPLLAVPNVTAHPSTASVAYTNFILVDVELELPLNSKGLTMSI